MDVVQDLERHAVRDFAKLWSSATKPHRIQMLKAQVKFTVAVTIMYVIVVAIYFGAVWNPVQYMSRLEVGVINEDRGNFVGDLIASQLAKLNSSQNVTYVHVTKEILNGRSPAQLAEDGDYWAVLHVPQNFTLAMNASVYGGKKPYTNRIYLIFDEGRMQGTISTIRTITGGIIRGLSSAVASVNFAKSARVPINTATADPNALATPLIVQEVNLHPVSTFGVNFVSFFGNVLVFGATLSSSMATGKTMKHMKGRVRPWHLLLSRLLHLLFLALLIPIIVALAVTAFGGVPVLNWISYYFFLVLFFFSSSVFICGFLEVIGKPAVGIAGVLLLLGLLASQGFVAIEQQHYFYYVGWVTPLFHAVMGSRHLLFGSYQKWFGLNIGVFCCYLFVGLVCMIGRTIYDHVRPPKPQELINKKKNKNGETDNTERSSGDEGEMISMDTATSESTGNQV